MIDPQSYRVRIGLFSIRCKCARKEKTSSSQDELALGLALVLTLLIIGGVEPNPGPTRAVNISTQSEEALCLTRSELKLVVAEAVEVALKNKAAEFGEALASDLHDALRAIDDEMGRFAMRLKRLEAWKTEHDADVKMQAKGCQTHDRATSKATEIGSISAPQKRQIKNNVIQNETDKEVAITLQDTNNGQQHATEETQEKGTKGASPATYEKGGWMRVARKNKQNKHRKYGGILIGGQNVTRIKAAAMDEFKFDQNVSFVNTTSDNFKYSLSNITGRSKAENIDVVIHLGADDALVHCVDDILKKLTDFVKYATQISNVKTVSVCSLEERRDAGPTVYQIINKVNSELAQLCTSTGSTFIDLRPRLEETKHGGINRTGFLYTFEGSHSVAQHILAEVPGFLD